ncbi:MAG: phosphate ABC transporter substrate-binding protein [Anaerolineae bacterium]
MRRVAYWTIALLLMLSFTAACAPAASTPASGSTSGGALSGKITAAGSTSLQPLAEKLSTAFMAANPAVEVDIQGGGSGVGVKSVQDGTAQLGMVSRELTAAEIATGINVYTVAKDAIVIIVNPDVTVTDLTKAQVQQIFAGTITNWKEVGGPDKPIVVVAREEGSGTRGAFQELVLGKDINISAQAILQSSNGAILSTVSSTPDSISFLSLGFVDSSIKVVAIDGVEGTEANAASGKYSSVRPLSFISKGEPTGVAKAFLDWALGPDGQKIVSEQGYLSVK